MGCWRNVFVGALATFAVLPALAQPIDLVPIITYDESHPLVEKSRIFPMVRVYATGDVVVYRAEGYRNPGLYELKLTDDELNEIRRLAQQGGVTQFDENEIVARLSENAEGEVFYSSDPTTSIFEFNRVNGADNLSAGDGTTADTTQTVALQDVSMTASTVSDSTLLGPLSALHERLLELFTIAGR
ncbi:MAG: hypothetical protein AB8B64_19075 [Granulosicoccus sp.]